MNKNIKIIGNYKPRFLAYVLGPLVFLLLSWLIYRQLLHQPNWRGSLTKVVRAVTGERQWKLWLVLALMPLNWGIEARKWQLALRPVGGIPYGKAFKAILTGTTLASFTPNRVGEYLGRVLYVEEGKRVASISLTIICSMSQLLITLIAGLTGILYFLSVFHQQPSSFATHFEFWLKVLLGVDILAILSLTFIYFRFSWLLGILRKIPVLGKYLAYIKVLENFDRRLLGKILCLSFGRYLVFMLQYGLIFPVFGVILSTGQVWGGVSLLFLIMAVVPTFTFLAELGVRWEASIQVLEIFSTNTMGIFAASFGIWLINLIIPALAGSLLILSIKIFRNKEEEITNRPVKK
ncbi:hypothetical protein ACX0G9_19850 [Flavitalea flava]